MKREIKQYIFGFLVVTVAFILVCCNILRDGGGEPAPTTLPLVAEAPTEDKTPAVTADPLYISQSKDLDKVTIDEIPLDPNEKIWRDSSLAEDDPEYVEYAFGDQYASAEGKVYQNNRILTTTVCQPGSDKTWTLSFGYQTGKHNKYLYLNPTCEEATLDKPVGFYFKTVSPCGVRTFSEYAEGSLDVKMFRTVTIRRCFDELTPCVYQDPQNPGAVWWAYYPGLDEYWVDVRVVDLSNYQLIATLRLTIERTDNGTYFLSGIQNKDLLRIGGNEILDKKELDYLYEDAKRLLETDDFYDIVQDDFPKESFCMEYLEEGSGLYFTYYHPVTPGERSALSGKAMYPVIAVSYNTGGRLQSFITMYYSMIMPPMNGEHGSYTFIGYDYIGPNTKDSITAVGCPDY